MTKSLSRRTAIFFSVISLSATTSWATDATSAIDTHYTYATHDSNDTSCAPSGDVTASALMECVSATGSLTHLQALSAIAAANGGNRAAGTRGHELSADYIAQKLVQAGYDVQYLPFPFVKYHKDGKGQFELVGATSATSSVIYEDEKDFNVMAFSPSGKVTAALVTAVDLQLGLGNTSTSGCEAADFADFKAGHIALIQRGSCPFQVKAENAQNAGAAGVIIFNQGDQPTREALFSGTLSGDAKLSIPVYAVATPFALELLKLTSPLMSMDVKTTITPGMSFNVVAETRSGNPDNVVMLGAHLDSVTEGAGLNDNGSGSAAILDVALKMRNVKPNNKLRFAWWSAEELGLVGSTKYVESLSAAERAKIAMYLNFDMIASPNYFLGVFDADGSKFGNKGPLGSGAIEQLFQMYFSMQGHVSSEAELSGRTDYAAFQTAGIAIGGMFTGAEGTKTAEQARLYGGTAGAAYDPCYHQACDGLSNLSTTALELNTDAIAFAALTFAYSTAAVDAEKAQASRRTIQMRSTPQDRSVRIENVGVVYYE